MEENQTFRGTVLRMEAGDVLNFPRKDLKPNTARRTCYELSLEYDREYKVSARKKSKEIVIKRTY